MLFAIFNFSTRTRIRKQSVEVKLYNTSCYFNMLYYHYNFSATSNDQITRTQK